MSNPRKSQSSLSRKVARLAALSGIAVALGLVAGLTPALAAPLSASGLAAPGLQVEEAGYRKYAQPYAFDRYASESNDWGPSYRIYRHIPGGNDEIRELQRTFPSTPWPPSLRY
ncbi:MAG: hypothetical protein ACRECI_10900 [Methyloceanibacter sp.]